MCLLHVPSHWLRRVCGPSHPGSAFPEPVDAAKRPRLHHICHARCCRPRQGHGYRAGVWRGEGGVSLTSVLRVSSVSPAAILQGGPPRLFPLMLAQECFDVTFDHAQTTPTHPVWLYSCGEVCCPPALPPLPHPPPQGIVPRECSSEEEVLERRQQGEDIRFCKRCRSIKPDRAHHCRWG